MEDVTKDETEEVKMVQTDTDCKRNSVISGKPKPPLPKKPAVAVKPKVPVKSHSLDRGPSCTSKAPPPLPKTPPKGPGGKSNTNALTVRSSPSPDRSCDLKSTNHIQQSGSSSHNNAHEIINHCDGLTHALSSQSVDDGHTDEMVFMRKGKTLERPTTDYTEGQTLSVGHSNTLPRVPPKVSPKPGKRPPSVMPKPRLSKNLSESDLHIDDNKPNINNNSLDSSFSSSNKEEPCTCGESLLSSVVKNLNGERMEETQVIENERQKDSLESNFQNGHSRPPPSTVNKNEDEMKTKSGDNLSLINSCHNITSNNTEQNMEDHKDIEGIDTCTTLDSATICDNKGNNDSSDKDKMCNTEKLENGAKLNNDMPENLTKDSVSAEKIDSSKKDLVIESINREKVEQVDNIKTSQENTTLKPLEREVKTPSGKRSVSPPVNSSDISEKHKSRSGLRNSPPKMIKDTVSFSQNKCDTNDDREQSTSPSVKFKGFKPVSPTNSLDSVHENSKGRTSPKRGPSPVKVTNQSTEAVKENLNNIFKRRGVTPPKDFKAKTLMDNSDTKSHSSNDSSSDDRRVIYDQLSVETNSHILTEPKLTLPSPVPRKPSPRPRPTPRKRLSLSKSCDKQEEYTDCISARSSIADSENSNLILNSNKVSERLSPLAVQKVNSNDSQNIKQEHQNKNEIESDSPDMQPLDKSNEKESSISKPCSIQIARDSEQNASDSRSDSISHSSDQSIGNLSSIESENVVEKNRFRHPKLSASHNLLQPDDLSSQRKIDFSPMTEEALGETSSLLDEIEQIVSRRISALGGLSSEFSLKKAHSIETSTPVRPPRKKQKNRKVALEEQFRDSYASDTDSILEDASFKGSNASLDCLNDGDQSFKGSNTSLASNQSETGPRKPIPPKPPRKKLLKLNRSQSDVSAAKYHERKKGKNENNSAKTDQDKYRKKDGHSPGCAVKKGRSLTVDFKVPANQEALLIEIELANQRNATISGQKVKPRRKAPPPPVKVTGPNNELVREAEYHDIDTGGSRTSSISDYTEIPEEFLELNGPSSNLPPELPPRNVSSGTPINSPQLSMKFYNTPMSTPAHGKDRPASEISVNSSLSSQESPIHDELSSSDSECEDENERVIRKRAKKIYNIVKEIASSEHVFVDVLRLLNVDFRLHISKATERAGRPVIPSEVLNRILKFLPQLQNFNEDLLKDLSERVANWEKVQKVADIFVKKGPFLKMYTSYIADFEETNKVFDDALKKIPTFQHAVKEFEMSPRCASLGIRHYLLKPIQRIPQYKLLFQDYLKHLSPDSEDYNNTKIALAIVSEVADHANSSMRQGDQVQKMLEIQKSLDGHFEVIKPGRDLIKEGELMKLSRKEMQPRMFFLFNDVLLYTTPTSTGGYRLNNVLTLAGMKVTLPASEEYNTEFNIVTVQRSFSVEASSVKERDEWVKALTEAISDYTQRRNTFETVKAGSQSFYDKDFVLGSKAPIWIPDARVTMCMLCTCEFSVAWRRHHCRSCGRVVCSSCSDNKAPLEYLRNKPARVCNECYHKLHKDFQDKVDSGTVTEGMTQDTDGSFLSLSSLKERFQQIRRSARFTGKVKRPGRLVEVHANDLDCSMSGNLKLLKGKKWKKYWFLLKDKVLYKFKASEDVAAIDTMPVIGYSVERVNEDFDGVAKNLVFQLSHKNRPPMVFQTENTLSTERWIKVMTEAAKA